MTSATKRLSLVVMLFCPVGLLTGQSGNGKTAPDPYRNFVGSWKGTSPIHPEYLPSTVTLTITEKPDGSAMVWNYTWGTVGEKGYEQSSKVIILNPRKGLMITKFGSGESQTMETKGLAEFAESGFGEFLGEQTVRGISPTNYGPYQVLRTKMFLQATRLEYLQDKGDSTNVISYFKFVRVSENPGEKSDKQVD